LLGFWLGTSHRGQGYMAAACRIAVTFGRQRLGLKSLRSRVLAGNFQSIAVLRRLGFHRDTGSPAEPPDALGQRVIHDYYLDDLETAEDLT